MFRGLSLSIRPETSAIVARRSKMSAEQTNLDRNSSTSRDLLRPVRRRVAIAWAAGLLSVALPLIERQLRAIHPLAVVFIILLVVTFGAALGAFVRGCWRLLRGPQRFAGISWAMLGLIPPLCWVALGWYGQRQWARRDVPHNLPMALVKLAATRLMEAQAGLLYPHRLETDRIVMFYGDGTSAPEKDLEAMDQHVARLESVTGMTHRAKIWWVRGTLLGQGRLAVGGLALGSSKSPAEHSDRHELAHAIIYQGDYPDTDPPTLLMEGWAEAQSADSETLANRAASARRYFAEMGSWWEEIEREKKFDTVVDPEGLRRLFQKTRDGGRIDSYLRTLSDPFWYHHDAGPVYSIGGAFVDFLLRRYGPERFIKLYFTVRPGTFEAQCQEIYGVDLNALETQFWQDVERQMLQPRPEEKTQWP
jgi:hypothetical protein